MLEQPTLTRPRNGLGIAALTLGIIGTVVGLIPILFIFSATLGIIALILGFAGRGRATRGEATNRKSATWGIVTRVAAIVLSVIGVVIVNDAFSGLEEDLNATTAVDQPISNSVNTDNPPAKDVKVTKCEVDNSFGMNTATAKLRATNHSSKASDYVISVEFVAKDGTRVGESGAFLTALKPDQTATTEALGDSGGKSAVTCKVTQVERFAS